MVAGGCFHLFLVERNPYFLGMKIFFKLKPIYLTYINECSTIVCFRAGYLVMVYASWSKQQAAWELRFQSVLCVS